MSKRFAVEFTESSNGAFIEKVRKYMVDNDVTSFKMALILLANKGLRG